MTDARTETSTITPVSSHEKDHQHTLDEKTAHHPGQAQTGVLKAEAALRVWGTLPRTMLFIGIGLVAYVYSLDGTTTYLYQAFATSSFGDHSLLASIAVAQGIILAVVKPPAAKIADVFGRAEAYIVAVVLYVVGYIIVASCKSFNTYAGGIIIYAAGQAAIQILQQIIIADVTSLQWRGLVSSLVSIPFFINAFVAPNIGANILAGAGWRWGYAMFAIIIPVASAPIIVTLAWGQRKAKILGIVATDYNPTSEVTISSEVHEEHSTRGKFLNAIVDLDLFGLLLFASGWSLMLIPLTLVNNATNTWNSPKIIAMITIGCAFLVAFVWYEAKVARLPIIPFRFFKNRTVVCACVIGFFDFVSFYLQYTYQYSFIYITHQDWSLVDQGYFAYTQLLSLTFFAILAGVYQLRFRRLKWLLVFGLFVRLIGVGVMIYTKGAHGSTAGLVLTQLVQGLGGGIAACASQTAVQGSVSHQDVAGVTAVYLLSAEIGGAVGTAIAGSVWRNTMPAQLSIQLSPYLNSTTIASIYGSITTANNYPAGSAIHEGIVIAYDNVMFKMLVASTCLAVIPLLASLGVRDFELGGKQNAVEEEASVDDQSRLREEKSDF